MKREEVGCFYSKITVSGNELLTLTNETLNETAGCIESQAELSQATAPKSADSCQAECITEARPGLDSTEQPALLARLSGSQVMEGTENSRLTAENKQGLNNMNNLQYLNEIDTNICTVCDIPSSLCRCTKLRRMIVKFANLKPQYALVLKTAPTVINQYQSF